MSDSHSTLGDGHTADEELFPNFETERFDPTDIPVPSVLVGAGWEPDAAMTVTEQGQSPVTTLGDLDYVLDADAEYADIVFAMMDRATCELCGAILQQLRTRPLGEQVAGTRELAELKQAAVDGASPVELAEVMEGFEVVADPGEM